MKIKSQRESDKEKQKEKIFIKKNAAVITKPSKHFEFKADDVVLQNRLKQEDSPPYKAPTKVNKRYSRGFEK